MPLALRSERQSSAGRAGALRGAPDSQAQEDHRAAHGRAENGRRYSAPFFEPLALTEEEIQTQIAAGHRPPLEDIVGLSLEKKGADVGPPAFVCLEPPSDHDHGPQEGGEEQGNKQPAQG